MNKSDRDNFSRNLLIGGGSLIAIILVALIVILNRPSSTDQEQLELLQSLPRGVTEEGLPFLGDEDAPVTMTIYEDLGCPNCRRFFLEVEPLVLTEYVATGKVKLVIYQLTFVNQNSQPGAEGAACAQDQGMYWEYRDVLFHTQGSRTFNRETLIDIAEELGLDRKQFSDCFDFATHAQEVLQRSNEAVEFGINSTPTSIINGQRHIGVIPFDRPDDPEQPGIKQILDEALIASGAN